MSQSFEQAVQSIIQGASLIYPTETFYALGCLAVNSIACSNILKLKIRERNKPLPVLIGSPGQLCQLTNWQSPELENIMQNFWPGPLSVLVPALPGLPGEIQNEQGWLSVRFTSHPVAQELCLSVQAPLVATSANFAGMPAVAKPEDLDPLLLNEVDFFLNARPWPSGGLASTLIRIQEQGRIQVLRAGAVSKAELYRTGLVLE